MLQARVMRPGIVDQGLWQDLDTKILRTEPEEPPMWDFGKSGSSYYYILVKGRIQTLWHARTFEDGTSHHEEIAHDQWGITDDDLDDAVRLAGLYDDPHCALLDHQFVPISGHIAKKLRILHLG
ncbi:MAG: hypothetical protein MUC66_07080 [Methanolinea sp.]|nr:hypothetical protein [Methanolinea sp.]